MIQVAGIRDDGAVWLVLDGGLSCILHEGFSSPAVDEAEVINLGPWTEATGIDAAARRDYQQKLYSAKGAPMAKFTPDPTKRKRKFKFEYETEDQTAAPVVPTMENVIGDKPDENPEEEITEEDEDEVERTGTKGQTEKPSKKKA